MSATIPSIAARSALANRFYWVAIVTPFAAVLQQYERRITRQEAHEELKRHCLAIPIVNELTGEVVAERIGSTAELNSVEFAAYIDRCQQYLRVRFKLETEVPKDQ